MYTASLQLSIATAQPAQQERSRRFQGVLTESSLRDENVLFEHSRGISRNNEHRGFVPGFCDRTTGELARSRFADGSAAPVHCLDGLPDAWIGERDVTGRVIGTRPGLISGFIRDGRFYTREEAMRAAAH